LTKLIYLKYTFYTEFVALEKNFHLIKKKFLETKEEDVKKSEINEAISKQTF